MDATQRDDLVERALAIAAGLRRSAVAVGGGALAWPALRLAPRRPRLQPLGVGLYDGAAGVALFLAAASHATDDRELRDVALRALRPLRDALDLPCAARTIVRREGIGAATGAGSLVYALARVGVLLDEPGLVRDAARLAAAIDPDDVGADPRCDVLDGAAGLGLCLLALHAADPEPRWLDLAVACGWRLLRGHAAPREVPNASIHERPPPSGFAYGTAGVAYALARLARVAAEPAFAHAAEEASAYDADARSCGSWCRGVAGVALASVLTAAGRTGRGVDDPFHALRRAAASRMAVTDDICCGNLGRALVLHAAARRLGDPRWLDEACRVCAIVVDRARRNGGFTTASGSDWHHPGLFQGVAGIGYALLAIGSTRALPLPLAWE
jgi:lantibiotic modifying enzyme